MFFFLLKGDLAWWETSHPRNQWKKWTPRDNNEQTQLANLPRDYSLSENMRVLPCPISLEKLNSMRNDHRYGKILKFFFTLFFW